MSTRCELGGEKLPRFLVVLPPPLDGDFSFSLFSGAVFEVGCADDRQRKKSHGHPETVALIFLKALDILQPLTVGQFLEGLPLALLALWCGIKKVDSLFSRIS